MKIARAVLPGGDIVAALVVGDEVRELKGVAPDQIVAFAQRRNAAAVEIGRVHQIGDVSFLSPIARPPSIRDFSAFEAHTKNCVEGMGGKMNPLWYELPVFYFSNPNCVINDGDEVHPPKRARSIDFELELACIIGKELRDLDADSGAWQDHVAGFMLMNDWSARDLAAQELKLFMGPAKGKDFATTLGPWIVTPDEFEIDGGKFAEPLTARVNGKTLSNGNASDMYFNWPRILAQASADCTLVPGDVIGSGTCGTGCLIELRITSGKDEHPWLKAGDLIELESPRLGILRNRIAG